MGRVATGARIHPVRGARRRRVDLVPGNVRARSTPTPWSTLAVIIGLGIGMGEATRHVERVRRRFTDTPHVNLTSVWTFSAALVLPPALTPSVIVALYLHLFWRSWYRVRSVHPYRLVFTASTVTLAAYVASTDPPRARPGGRRGLAYPGRGARDRGGARRVLGDELRPGRVRDHAARTRVEHPPRARHRQGVRARVRHAGARRDHGAAAELQPGVGRDDRAGAARAAPQRADAAAGGGRVHRPEDRPHQRDGVDEPGDRRDPACGAGRHAASAC